MRHLLNNRPLVCALLASIAGGLAFKHWPFPEDHGLLQLVFLHEPMVFIAIKWAYVTMLFTTPFAAFSVVSSLGYIFLVKSHQTPALAKLPTYPAVAAREQLFLVVGELHHPQKRYPAKRPGGWYFPNAGSSPASRSSGRSAAARRPAAFCPLRSNS